MVDEWAGRTRKEAEKECGHGFASEHIDTPHLPVLVLTTVRAVIDAGTEYEKIDGPESAKPLYQLKCLELPEVLGFFMAQQDGW